MPKKPPSLEKQTQWHVDRARYAQAVLAGVRFEKVSEPYKPRINFGMTYRTVWYYTMPHGGMHGPCFNRRKAVEAALTYLENGYGLHNQTHKEKAAPKQLAHHR